MYGAYDSRQQVQLYYAAKLSFRTVRWIFPGRKNLRVQYCLHRFTRLALWSTWFSTGFKTLILCKLSLTSLHGYTWAVSIHMGENFVHSMPVQYFFQAIKIHRTFIRRTHYVDNYRVFYRCQDLCHGKTILTWISTGTIVLSPGK